MTVVAEQTFAPPRPGVWFLDPTHFTRPATRFHAELFPEQMIAGFSEGLRRYGSLLEYLDLAFVNGFFYYCPRPVAAPQEAVGHPPREVWDELAASQPDIRARLETSATVFERKLWREELERWDREVKPAAIRDHLDAAGSRADARSGQTNCSPTSTAVARTRSTAPTSTTSSTCPRWFRSGTSSCTRASGRGGPGRSC